MKKKSQMQRFSPVQQIFSIRTQPPQNENVLYNIPPPLYPSLSSLNTFVNPFRWLPNEFLYCTVQTRVL